MSYDLDKSHPFSIPFGGIRGDLGYVDVSADVETFDVATTLSRCWGGFGIVKDNAGNNPITMISSDGDITNSNITFRRLGNAFDTSGSYWFVLFGV